MHEQLTRYYAKEEEFLDHFESAAIVAAQSLHGAWSPDYQCDDAVRRRRERLLAEGGQEALVFSGAAMYQRDGRFSSVQIALKSSTRTVNVRVRQSAEADLVAETIVDRAKEDV